MPTRRRSLRTLSSATTRTRRLFLAIQNENQLLAPEQVIASPETQTQYKIERWSSSGKQGTVELPRFYIGRYEVTVAQFRAFVEATRHRVDAQALTGAADLPVGFVSWPDALAYCRWLEATLSERLETPAPLQRLVRDGWRVTLPNEAQWEKAARLV